MNYIHIIWDAMETQIDEKYKFSSENLAVGQTGTEGNNFSEQYRSDFCSKIFQDVPIELPCCIDFHWISIFKFTVYVSVSFSSIEIRSLSLSSVNSNIVLYIGRKFTISSKHIKCCIKYATLYLIYNIMHCPMHCPPILISVLISRNRYFVLNTFPEYVFTVVVFEFMLDELMKYNPIW